MSGLPDIRVGDQEREHAQTRLREAYGKGALTLEEFEDRLEAALSATTRGQLEPLTADLPASTSQAAGVELVDHPDTAARNRMVALIAVAAVILAVVAGTVGRGADAVSVFGSTVYVPPVSPNEQNVQEIRVFSLFGSVEVDLPAGVTAVNRVTPIFGSSDCGQACRDEPDVSVSGLSIFGSVEITGG